MKARSILKLFESNDSVILYHGGKDLKQSFSSDDITHSKGRWEYGPGLYLTTEYDIASKYAKGSRKLYLVTVSKGTNISKVLIPLDDIQDFLKQYGIGSKSKEVMESLYRIAERVKTSPKVSADYFLNNVINSEAVKSSNTGRLRRFLVDRGVDYSIDTYEGHPLLVVFNSSKIEKVQEVDRSKVKEFSMPFGWKRS